MRRLRLMYRSIEELTTNGQLATDKKRGYQLLPEIEQELKKLHPLVGGEERSDSLV